MLLDSRYSNHVSSMDGMYGETPRIQFVSDISKIRNDSSNQNNNQTENIEINIPATISINNDSTGEFINLRIPLDQIKELIKNSSKKRSFSQLNETCLDICTTNILLCSGIPEDVTIEKIRNVMSMFGITKSANFLPNNQAVVEFDTNDSVTSAINYSRKKPIQIGDAVIYVSPYEGPSLKKSNFNNPSSNSVANCIERRVLMVQFDSNTRLEIEDIRILIDPISTVLKAIKVTKRPVYFLLQFSDENSASKVKIAIESNHLPNNLGPITVEFARTSNLRINQISKNTFIKENCSNPSMNCADYSDHAVSDSSYKYPYSKYDSNPDLGSSNNHLSNYSDKYDYELIPENFTPYSDNSLTSSELNDNVVLCLTGMHHKIISCDRVYNLFCTFGCIYKVILPFKQLDTAFIQFGSPKSAFVASNQMNKIKIFDRPLNITISKTSFLSSFTSSNSEIIVYSNNIASSNMDENIDNRTFVNRFIFFNNGPSIEAESKLRSLFYEFCPNIRIFSVQIFDNNEDRYKKPCPLYSSGIIETESCDNAASIIFMCNHLDLNRDNSTDGSIVHPLKLEFLQKY